MSTFCKTRSCWGHHHEVCLGDWVSAEGTLFRCICECHGSDRLTPVAAGADLGHDFTNDEGDGGMGSGDWLERLRR
jgi:hypothetical protein